LTDNCSLYELIQYVFSHNALTILSSGIGLAISRKFMKWGQGDMRDMGIKNIADAKV
jgi:hypothetical protein